jgi:hypothetical protein
MERFLARPAIPALRSLFHDGPTAQHFAPYAARPRRHDRETFQHRPRSDTQSANAAWPGSIPTNLRCATVLPSRT